MTVIYAETSHQLLDELPLNLLQLPTVYGGKPLTFHLAPSIKLKMLLTTKPIMIIIIFISLTD